jgi:polyisoprenoid-binding protein YceI
MKNRLVIHAKRKDVNSEQSMVKNGMITWSIHITVKEKKFGIRQDFYPLFIDAFANGSAHFASFFND